MTYKDKLDKFNENEKYYDELLFLQLMLSNEQGKILDYGCGTGFAVSCLRSHGFDVSGYDAIHHEPGFEYSNATDEYKIVYFMHSFAHIHAIREVLKTIKTEQVIVITPNQEWISEQRFNPLYKPDSTVIQHYSKNSLEELFVSCGFDVDLSGQFGQRTGNFCERLILKATKIK